jgi:hypothetical protein
MDALIQLLNAHLLKYSVNIEAYSMTWMDNNKDEDRRSNPTISETLTQVYTGFLNFLFE